MMIASGRPDGKADAPAEAVEIVARLRADGLADWPLLVAAGRALDEAGVSIGFDCFAVLVFGEDAIRSWVRADVQARLDRELADRQAVERADVGEPAWFRRATPDEAAAYRQACKLLDDLAERTPYLLAALRQEPGRRAGLAQLLTPFIEDVLAAQGGAE